MVILLVEVVAGSNPAVVSLGALAVGTAIPS